MNKKQYQVLVAKKNLLEKKLKSLQENKRRNSVSFLIESELEKAELVLAAKAIVDKIGKMAEDMLSLESDELMPMMDSLKEAYGPQMAEAFQKLVAERLRAATASLSQTKDAISGEVSKLEGVFNGQPANDMGTDTGADPLAPADPATDLDDAPADQPPVADTAPEKGDDAAPAPSEGGDDAVSDFFGDNDDGKNAAGRARKESARRRGKPLNEGLLDSIKTVLTAHFDEVAADRSPREQLEALKTFITASDYEVASQFPDHLLQMIFDRDTSSGPDNSLEATLPAVAPEVNMDGDYDDLESEIDGLADDLNDDTYMPPADQPAFDEVSMVDQNETSPMGMAFEGRRSAVKRLRESKNPDAMIFGVYKAVVREGIAPRKAARKVAETFQIDFADVVAVIREAKDNEPKCVKPHSSWNKLYKDAKEDGLAPAAIVGFICDNTSDKCATEDKAAYRKAVKAWVDTKKVPEGKMPPQFAANIKKKNGKRVEEVSESENSEDIKTGFDVLNADRVKFGKPSNPAVMTKGDGKDPAGKSLVVGGSEPKATKVAEAVEKTAKPYHVIVSKIDGKKWGIQFGDYDKKVAQSEMADLKRSSKDAGRKEQFKLITVSDDKQKTSNEAVARLNESAGVKKK